MAEQLFCKQQVVGSNPTDGSETNEKETVGPRLTFSGNEKLAKVDPRGGSCLLRCRSGQSEWSVKPSPERATQVRILAAAQNLVFFCRRGSVPPKADKGRASPR